MNPFNLANQLSLQENYSIQKTPLKIEELPIDILTTIFEFLNLERLPQLNILNKNFNNKICQVVAQKRWFTKKFKETLHIKFQNDPRVQLIKSYKAELFFNGQRVDYLINVPTNKNKEKLNSKIISFTNNEGPKTCKEANDLVKKIFSCFIGNNTYAELKESYSELSFSGDMRPLLSALNSCRSKDEESEILWKSFVFFDEEGLETCAWNRKYCNSSADANLAQKIFNIAKQSTNPRLNKTEVFSACLLKNEALIDEAYAIAYQIFESNEDTELLEQCIKINPKLALEVFERYKNKKPKYNTDLSRLYLLALCVSSCPEKLSKEGFRIAKKKIVKFNEGAHEAIELLVACIKTNPELGQESLDLVESKNDYMILEVLLAWVSVDAVHACPAIYEYLEHSISELVESQEMYRAIKLIKICLANDFCIPNFFESSVQLLKHLGFGSSFPMEYYRDILKILLERVPILPLDKNRFDLLFDLIRLYPKEPINRANFPPMSSMISDFCSVNLVLAIETIKNIKKLENQTVISTIFLSLLKHYPNLAIFIFKETQELIEQRQINDFRIIKGLLISCVLADSELSSRISMYIQEWPNQAKNEVLQVCVFSKKRKLQEEATKSKKVNENQLEYINPNLHLQFLIK